MTEVFKCGSVACEKNGAARRAAPFFSHILFFLQFLLIINADKRIIDC